MVRESASPHAASGYAGGVATRGRPREASVPTCPTERAAALSDGLFSIAATLLVIDVRLAPVAWLPGRR